MSRFSWLRVVLVILFVVTLGAISASPVCADIAAPPPPVGSDLSPGNSITNVRMVSETVTLDISGDASHPFGEAVVNARFNMRNLRDTPE
jgi:hypothetical protein